MLYRVIIFYIVNIVYINSNGYVNFICYIEWKIGKIY